MCQLLILGEEEDLPQAAQDEHAVPPEMPDPQLPQNAPNVPPEPPLDYHEPAFAPPDFPPPQPVQPAAASPPPPLHRSTRVHRPPGEWWKAQQHRPNAGDEQNSNAGDGEPEHAKRVHSGQSTPDPQTLKQALSRSDSDKWKAAADLKIEAHLSNGTWEPCKLPPGCKAIGCRWVFNQKFNADGSVERYKGRLVAKGYSQHPGFDYVETFAPTVRMASIRTVLALSVIEDLHLCSVDISHTFINGTLEAEIYMQQPEGYHFGNPGDVLRLKKSLYGLKQAERVWNKTLHDMLCSMGFNCLKSDSSLYVYSRGSTRIIISIPIDDMTISSTSDAESDKVVAELSKHFELHDLGPTSFLLSIQITGDHPHCSISLSQCQYIVDMLDQFGFSGCAPVQTPMEPGLQLSTEICPKTPEE